MAKKTTNKGVPSYVPPLARGASDELGPSEPYVFETEEAELAAEVGRLVTQR